MALSKEDIEYISSLARMELGNEEKEKYREELSAILDFVGQLKEVDTKNIEPLYQTTGLENIMRDDKNPYSVEEANINEILKQVPKREGNLVKVNPVLDKSR